MSKTVSRPAKPTTMRCAIYTRKSTEEGLDQDFNTLDAQRESGEAYIRSQTHEGWICVPDRYDDGGFTGGNMDRPALQRLLSDIDAKKWPPGGFLKRFPKDGWDRDFIYRVPGTRGQPYDVISLGEK